MLFKFTTYCKLFFFTALIFACEPSQELNTIEQTADLNLLLELSSHEINSFVLSSASLMVNEFRFEGEAPNDQEVKIEIEDDNGFQVDLITGVFEPELTFSIPSGPYEEIELRIESDARSSSPSLAIGGHITDSLGASTTVRFEYNGALDFRLEIKQEDDPFLFSDDFLDFFEVHIDLIDSFQDIEDELWMQAERNDDGIIVISKESNNPLFDKIVANIKTEVRIKIDN